MRTIKKQFRMNRAILKEASFAGKKILFYAIKYYFNLLKYFMLCFIAL